MKRVLILEDDEEFANLFPELLVGDEIEVVVVRTADEAREAFGQTEFDAIALDGIAPRRHGRPASLVGPILARELRMRGYIGPIIATSNDPGVQALTKKGANEIVRHLAYPCDKLDLPGLLREILRLWPKTLD